MKKNITFSKFKNPVNNFGMIIKELKEIAERDSVPVTKVLNDFISALKNFNNEDSEIEFQDIVLKGLTPEMIKDFTIYANRMKKIHTKKESQSKKNESKKSNADEIEVKWTNIETSINKLVLDKKQGTEIEILKRTISEIEEGKSKYDIGKKEKKSILKRLNDRLSKACDKQEREKKDKINAEKAMQQIEEIVEREYSKENIKDEVKYWVSIKDIIANGSKDNEFNIKIGKGAKEQLLKIIDERISLKKDKIYYNQVKTFTNDFQFLMQYPEIVRSMHGGKNKKFTDKESYDRFCSLRLLLQKGYDEYTEIDNLLKSKDIDDADKKILTVRKSVMDKEKNNKQKPDEAR